MEGIIDLKSQSIKLLASTRFGKTYEVREMIRIKTALPNPYNCYAFTAQSISPRNPAFLGFIFEV